MPADHDLMARAIRLAEQGRGHVEPNPMVGCLVVDPRGEVVGEGWHERFGGPHAEVNALTAAGERARGGALVVTLEPCCHTGKTGPCTRAIIAAGVKRVVIGVRDPFPQVDGGGIAELERAGIACEIGVAAAEVNRLLAPYQKLVTSGRPWIIAKWAMTLDGKIATRTGSSQWISSPAAREIVHQLRGRVDAVVVGARTAKLDDPLLTARPVGPRVATRVVIGDIDPESKLATSLDQAPLIVATTDLERPERFDSLVERGGEVLWLPVDRLPDRESQLDFVLAELGRRRMTNVLVEGGGRLLGTLFDLDAIDEVHVFVAPKLVGGRDAVSPIAGVGIGDMGAACNLVDTEWQAVGGDLYFTGQTNRTVD